MVLQSKSRSARRKRQGSGQHILYALLVSYLWTEVTCLPPLRQLIPPMALVDRRQTQDHETASGESLKPIVA
ncbi:hypothetical protein BDV19DRAFT_351956 [Aspergillus venezuelensis]